MKMPMTNTPTMSTIKVEYTCEDASFDMKGNNTATCKYNGQWSGAPQCILKSESSKRISKIILILLSIMFVAVSLLVLILIVKLKRKETKPSAFDKG